MVHGVFIHTDLWNRYYLNYMYPKHIPKEYVASLIGLYKNSGAVSCVAIIFLLIWPLYLSKTECEKVVGTPGYWVELC